MAKDSVGGGPRGPRGGTGGGGKPTAGPRQPAGRKQGTAGAVKAGPRGTFGKGPTGKSTSAPGGQARGKFVSDTKPARPTGGRPSDRPSDRPAGQRTSWGEDKRPRTGGSDTGGGQYRGKWESDPRPGASRQIGRSGDTRPPRPAGDRPSGGGEFRPARTGAPKPAWSGGDRKPASGGDYRPARSGDTRPPRPAGDRPARSGDTRPARSGDSKAAWGGGDKRPSTGGRPAADQGRGRGEYARPERPRFEKPVSHAPVQKPAYEDRQSQPELENKVVGINPVTELLKAGGRAVDTLFMDSTKGGKQFNDIINAARALGVTVKFAPKEALDGMSAGLRHQGVVAVVSPKEYADPDALLDSVAGNETPPLFILLDGVEDPQNLGAVIRTADCAGVDGVFIPEHRAAHLSASVAKSSAGALEHVPVAKVKNMAAFIENLKERGVWVVGVEAGADSEYTGFNMDVPVAIVLGGEGTGVRPVVLKACDAVVSLPLMGHVNSLNVSVAAGVVLYEVLRQRRG